MGISLTSIQIIMILWYTFYQIHNIKKSYCRDNTTAAISELEEVYIKSKKTTTGETNLDSINLHKFFYAKPSFVMFVDHLIPKNQGAKLKFNPPYSDWLHCTLRAILDCKWYDSVYNEKNGHEPTSFPEFVYSWMGNFCVDDKTRTVKEIEWFEKDRADEFRLQLLLGLQSQRSNTNWESYNFRELIEEKFSKDETYFFLHCRNLLYKGPQLRTTPGISQPIQYVTLEKVQEILDIIMEKATDDEKRLLKNQLKEYIKDYKQPNESIDSAMVLRVLLEYYLREKKVKIALLECLYNDIPKIGIGAKETVAFTSFRRMMEQFDKDITQVDVKF